MPMVSRGDSHSPAIAMSFFLADSRLIIDILPDCYLRQTLS